MFKIFANAWRVEDIRKKLLFIFLLLFIYRIGAVLVPLPGIDLYVVRDLRPGFWELIGGGGGDGVMTLFALLMGGELGTVFAMGIAPYITASIIMQLLTYAIPALSQMQKEDEDGRKKIQQITRYMAVVLALLQSAGMVYSYTLHGAGWLHEPINLFGASGGWPVYIAAVVAMTTGTIFIMWLAELLTEKGIGNGASFLIFANILAGLPMGIGTFYQMLTDNPGVMSVVLVIVLLLTFALIIAFVVLVHEGERRIPVQYSRKAAGGGRAMMGNHQSYIPLKVNIAGVLSIIFAMSFIGVPVMIGQFFQGDNFINTIAHYVDFNRTATATEFLHFPRSGLHPIGAIIYIILIFLFTHFYTSFAVNPIDMAENLKKNGGFIPGIRPGAPTSTFIQTTVNRLSWIGAFFYSLIALTPIIMGWIVPEMSRIAFGGTSLLIVTGVALEFVKQMESQLLMRHYKGFLE
ncbi:MAG: preprotein translocase subunit SecY [Defluviitaleaceae bacterium]|nr:preprotein translocase subunit SecY [Defluviitaleaceae bacterium]